MYDINHHQLRIILERRTPRIDVWHKVNTFLTYLEMDGKKFVHLPDDKLAE